MQRQIGYMFLFLILIVQKPDENIERNYINDTATVKVNAIAISTFACYPLPYYDVVEDGPTNKIYQTV